MLGIGDRGLGILVSRNPAQQEAFDSAAAWHAPADQPRRKYASVVEHEQIARTQMVAQPGKRRVLDRASAARKDEEPRLPALGRRMLRDQIRRQLEIEITRVQRPLTFAPYVPEKNLSRLVRPLLVSSGFQRSPTFLMRWRTVSIVKSSMRIPFSISFHVTGVETVASGLGRTE